MIATKKTGLPVVEREYWFDTEDGPRTLAELFDGRPRLLVPHFAFDAGWGAASPSCWPAAGACDRSFGRLAAGGVTLVAVSPAPIDAIVGYKWRMGWSFPWVSSLGTVFDDDFGVPIDGGRPRLSAFSLHAGTVIHTQLGGEHDV